jgi:hypothetical protein
MPARKTRLGVSAQDRVYVEAETAQLREAAARGSELVDRLERTRAQAAEEAESDPAAVSETGRRKGWWPFARKVDALSARSAELMKELEAVVRGRPQTSPDQATEAQAPQAGRKVDSAA